MNKPSVNYLGLLNMVIEKQGNPSTFDVKGNNYYVYFNHVAEEMQYISVNDKREALERIYMREDTARFICLKLNTVSTDMEQDTYYKVVEYILEDNPDTKEEVLLKAFRLCKDFIIGRLEKTCTTSVDYYVNLEIQHKRNVLETLGLKIRDSE